MKRIIAFTTFAVFLAAGAFAGGTWWAHRSGGAPTSAHPATVYTCPMDTDYHSDHPGACPCLLYTSPSPRDGLLSRMPSSA